MDEWSSTVPDMWRCWHKLIPDLQHCTVVKTTHRIVIYTSKLEAVTSEHIILETYPQELSPLCHPTSFLPRPFETHLCQTSVCFCLFIYIFKVLRTFSSAVIFFPFIFVHVFIAHTCFSFCKKKSTSASHTHKHVQKMRISTHTHITMNFCTISTPILHLCLPV